jgi:Ca-activated chloride channel family protein
MPAFAHPWLLLLLPLAPLAAWVWLRRRCAALRYPDLRPLTDLPPGRSRRARAGGAGLRAAGLAALVLALAGPRWPDPGTRLPVEGIAVVMALDVSGSMAEPDFDWRGARVSRLEAAKRAFRLFVQGGEVDGKELPGRANDQIGLVAFAAHPEDTCPLTLSHDVLLQLLDAEQPRGQPDTGTNIGDALAWALKKLEPADDCRKVLVLLSDGEHNVPEPALTPRRAAQLAGNQEVAVYCIDAGGLVPPGATTEETHARETGQQALKAVATMTGGRAFAAHDAGTLLEVMGTIDRLERRPAESFQYRRYAEGYPWLAAAALACFAAALGLELTVWRRMP